MRISNPSSTTVTIAGDFERIRQQIDLVQKMVDSSGLGEALAQTTAVQQAIAGSIAASGIFEVAQKAAALFQTLESQKTLSAIAAWRDALAISTPRFDFEAPSRPAISPDLLAPSNTIRLARMERQIVELRAEVADLHQEVQHGGQESRQRLIQIDHRVERIAGFFDQDSPQTQGEADDEPE